MMIILLIAAMILGGASINDRTQEKLDEVILIKYGDVYMPVSA